jgi:hypothetical protein
VERKRAELAHLEDHLRRLRQDLTQLQLELEAANNSDDPQSANEAQKRLAELENQLSAEQAKLTALREEKKNRPPRVVIVPYQGTNGTDRRPIYVECTDAAVIIQPEGIRITANQLDGPLGPGNPLDAALRTIRSHWRSLDPDAPPPYPLLLVRPGGIYAYGACRTAMASWDDQFGYELVPDEVQLAFPKPDPDLANKLAAAIDDAVQRQRGRLVAGTGNGGPSGFAPRSGSSQYGGGGTGDLASSNTSGSGARVAPSSSIASSPNPTSTNGTGANGTGTNGTGANGTGTKGTSGTDTTDGTARGTTTTGSTGASSPATTQLAAGSPDANKGSAGFANPGTKGGPEDAEETRTDDALADGGTSFAGGNSSTASSSAASSSTASSSTASSGGANTGADNGSSSSPTQSAANNAASADSLRVGSLDLSSEPFDPHAKTFSEAVNEQSSASRVKPPTNSPPPILRAGNNWALPESSLQIRGANIVRQMRLRCEPGQFVLLPENKPGSVLRQFPVENGDVEGAVMQLASSLRDRIAGWGVAMQNGRWDPVLVVQVAPGAEGRFRQLQAILRDSGIRVEQETSP